MSLLCIQHCTEHFGQNIISTGTFFFFIREISSRSLNFSGFRIIGIQTCIIGIRDLSF